MYLSDFWSYSLSILGGLSYDFVHFRFNSNYCWTLDSFLNDKKCFACSVHSHVLVVKKGST
jgi:hypothetical protein